MWKKFKQIPRRKLLIGAGVLTVLLLLLMVLLIFLAPPQIQQLAFSEEELLIPMGEQAKTTVQFEPTNASKPKLTYETSDASVAKVDRKGVITGVNPGMARITAQHEKTGLSAQLTVQVVRPMETMVYDPANMTIQPGGAKKTHLLVQPSDAYTGAIVYASSNESVVQCAGNSIKGIALGEAEITATDTLTGQTAKLNVVVAALADEIRVSETSVSLLQGESKTITAEVLPEEAADKDVTWQSSDSQIAKVDSSGTITGLREGTCTVTVTNEASGVQQYIEVEVLPEAIELDPDEANSFWNQLQNWWNSLWN